MYIVGALYIAIGMVVEARQGWLTQIIHEYFYYEFKLPAIKGNA